jgi:hypothetical protein
MPKEVMRRNAGDNQYLHKDFHGALSCGIDYLEQHFGDDVVREYLRGFTVSYYAPLIEELKNQGLVALKEYFAKMYETEGQQIEVDCSEDELFIRVPACPAVTHMRRNNYPVARLFYETTKTVNEAMCEGTPFAAELVEYDDETGRSVQRFYRRRS